MNAAWTIIGISKETETCQIRGQDSHDSPYWKKKPPDGHAWSGERLTKKQTTSWPDYLWPEMWKDMSEAAQRKEKPNWAIEKPKFDNARGLRGIYFIDPADAEFKEIIITCGEVLEVPMPAVMLCKICMHR